MHSTHLVFDDLYIFIEKIKITNNKIFIVWCLKVLVIYNVYTNSMQVSNLNIKFQFLFTDFIKKIISKQIWKLKYLYILFGTQFSLKDINIYETSYLHEFVIICILS